MAAVESSYTIGGVKVLFPCKAYPSQISMMDKIIKGLERKQNCLLESPTGSGKSLALLCSALAWQASEYEKVRQAENEEQADQACSCVNEKPAQSCAAMATESANQVTGGSEANINGYPGNQTVITIDDDDDDDFRPSKKSKPVVPPGGASADQDYINGTVTDRQKSPKVKQCCSCQCQEQTPTPRRKVPKIFFGTRTHKQIAQITKELGRTAYKHVRMCILSSREHSCIHPEVSRMSNKNEECKNRRDGPGCRFFERSKMLNHSYLQDKGLGTAWDLEDFLGLCKKSKACAYFGARGLKDVAQIIFCPYNYLVDPGIRERMEISVKDQIVILDEAHNVEDSAREAASYSVSQTKLQESLSDFNHMVNEGFKVPEISTLTSLCRGMEQFITQNSTSIEGSDYNQAFKVWSGLDMIAQFQLLGLGQERLKELKKAYVDVTEDSPDDKEKGIDNPKLKSVTRSVVEGLISVLENIYKENMKFKDDYRVAIGKTISYEDMPTGGVWLNKRKKPRTPTIVFTVSFWCMNPAVCFSDLGSAARSIVLTSGTLSPMTSFESELGVPFAIQLEANHVIAKSQVWVGAVSRGPNGGQLLGTYQTAETYGYQDEIGRLVLEVCQTIPHGVLCFLPSYKSLDKLVTRWRATGLWDEIQEHKHAMTEPRSSDKADFEDIISYFYQCIQDTDSAEAGHGVTGALFLAVCRGKVSEGLDFTDNNARAVITVGIPFPNFKDKQIELKQRYNDEHISRGLLKGRDWYEIQAFRALNQALGRCIRHKKDWGALILVDERFVKTPRYIKSLSKWIRTRVQYHSMFSQAKMSLTQFTDERLNPAADLTMSASDTLNNTTMSTTLDLTATPSGVHRTQADGPASLYSLPRGAQGNNTSPQSTTNHQAVSPDNPSPSMIARPPHKSSPTTPQGTTGHVFIEPAPVPPHSGTNPSSPMVVIHQGAGFRRNGTSPMVYHHQRPTTPISGTNWSSPSVTHHQDPLVSILKISPPNFTTPRAVATRLGGPRFGGPSQGGPSAGGAGGAGGAEILGGGFLSESQQAISQQSLNQSGAPSQLIKGSGFGEDIVVDDDDVLDFNPPLASTQMSQSTPKPAFKPEVGLSPTVSPMVVTHGRTKPSGRENLHNGLVSRQGVMGNLSNNKAPVNTESVIIENNPDNVDNVIPDSPPLFDSDEPFPAVDQVIKCDMKCTDELKQEGPLTVSGRKPLFKQKRPKIELNLSKRLSLTRTKTKNETDTKQSQATSHGNRTTVRQEVTKTEELSGISSKMNELVTSVMEDVGSGGVKCVNTDSEILGTRRSRRVRRAQTDLPRESKRQKSLDSHPTREQGAGDQMATGMLQVVPGATPVGPGVKLMSPIVIQPQEASESGTAQSVTPQMMREAIKCKDFLSKVCELSLALSGKTASIIQGHVQALLDGHESPEEFTTCLQEELGTSRGNVQNLANFLQTSLPVLRRLMVLGQVSIQGVRPPDGDVTCPQCDTRLTSLSSCTPHTQRPVFLQAAGWSPDLPLVSTSDKEVKFSNLQTCRSDSPQSLKGVVLNSYWSEEDRCCVRMLSCTRCSGDQSSLSPVLGIQVLFSDNPELPPTRVWFQTT